MVMQVLAYTGNEDAKKIFLDGEVSLDTIKVISEKQTLFFFFSNTQENCVSFVLRRRTKRGRPLYNTPN
jgi:hypothetical protein